MTLSIKPATPGEGAIALSLVKELSVYERLEHEVDADAASFEAALFGPKPRVFCDLARWDGEVVGLAIWFYNFSTFRGRHGIYLEDLYVQPRARGRGIGKALFQQLAQRCVDEELTRLEWSVLDWNTPAVDFYKAQGAELMDGWTICRLAGDALQSVAGDFRQ